MSVWEGLRSADTHSFPRLLPSFYTRSLSQIRADHSGRGKKRNLLPSFLPSCLFRYKQNLSLVRMCVCVCVYFMYVATIHARTHARMEGRKDGWMDGCRWANRVREKQENLCSLACEWVCVCVCKAWHGMAWHGKSMCACVRTCMQFVLPVVCCEWVYPHTHTSTWRPPALEEVWPMHHVCVCVCMCTRGARRQAPPPSFTGPTYRRLNVPLKTRNAATQ